MGVARSAYSTLCRWYVGGPVGRIRYYFVPPTNRVYYGTNVFWPSTELLSDFSNVDGPGEIKAAPRAWERGSNLRPDLVGDHVAGTADDFAGLTPVPVIQPSAPACTETPGLTLPLEIRAAFFRGLGHLSDASFVLQLQAFNLVDCLLLWLDSQNPGPAPVPPHACQWFDRSGYHHDASNDNALFCAHFAAVTPTGLTVPAFRQYRFVSQHIIENMQIGFRITPCVFSAYLCGDGGRTIHVSGANLDGSSAVGGILGLKDGNVHYGDPVAGGSWGLPGGTGDFPVLSARRWTDHFKVDVDGQTVGSGAAPASGHVDISGIDTTFNALSPFTGNGPLAEVLVFSYALPDDLHEAVIAYLRAKYQG